MEYQPSKKLAVVRIQGGCGNQLFQYLFGVSSFPEADFDLCFDCSPVFGSGQTRSFALTELGLPGNFLKAQTKFFTSSTIGESMVTLSNIEWLESAVSFHSPIEISLPVINETQIAFDSSLSTSQAGYYNGYWQSSNYWNETDHLLRLISIFLNASPLSLKISTWSETLNIRPDICSVHIRATDYLKGASPQYHGCCELSYFDRAMRDSGASRFHVYTDDEKYAKTLLGENNNIQYISSKTNHDLVEFMLLTRYKKSIISNSSFSYLSARIATALDVNNWVCAPYPWYSFKDVGPDLPLAWHRLNRKTGNNEAEDQLTAQNNMISVVIIIGDHGQDISSGLQSVLIQSHPIIELLLSPINISVNDSIELSTLIKKYPAIELLEPSSNIPAARNKAVLRAKGEYIAFIEPTVLWDQKKLHHQLNAAIKMAADLIVCSAHYVIDHNAVALQSQIDSLIKMSWEQTLSIQNIFISISNVMVRRKALIEEDLFDETLSYVDDHDMWRRFALAKRRIVVMDEKLTQHDTSAIQLSPHSDRISGELMHLDKIIRDPRTPSGVSVAFLERLMNSAPVPVTISLVVEPVNPPIIEQILFQVNSEGLTWALLIRLNKNYLYRYAFGIKEKIKQFQNLKAIKNYISSRKPSKLFKNEAILIYGLLKNDKRQLVDYSFRAPIKLLLFLLSIMIELPLYIKKKIVLLFNKK
jgi:hypothetical protein